MAIVVAVGRCEGVIQRAELAGLTARKNLRGTEILEALRG